MDAAQRQPAFRKDPFEETFLDRLNQLLQPLNEEIKLTSKKPFPSILIIAPPRSGSTLLFQSLCARLDVGYPSNLMARFYKTPLIGAYLQKRLINNAIHSIRNFKNQHGTTKGVEEPNEFGYFWSQHLKGENSTHAPSQNKNSERTTVEPLQKELNLISSIFRKPTIYKCTIGTFFLSFLQNIPNVFFIFLQRDTTDTGLSILKARPRTFRKCQ